MFSQFLDNITIERRNNMDPKYLILFFSVFILTGMPITYVLGITGLMSIILMGNIPLVALPQMMWTSLDSFPLMALPFFILAGEIMNTSGITVGLIDLSKLLVGRFRGGLAYASVVACTFFASITGSASATAAAVGGMMVPSMEKEGYDKDFSAATIAAASVLGPIIPPSTVMVMLAVTAGLSIGGLFLTGYVPGILYSIGLMVYISYKAKKENYPINKMEMTNKEKLQVIKSSVPAAIMPLIMMGGILGGVFTATEAAAVSCVYGLFVGFFYMKTLKLKDLPVMITRTAVLTAAIDFILAGSNVLGWTLTVYQVPRIVAEWFLSISTNPIVILMLINILFLIMGCFMEIMVSVVMLTPILFPLVESLGIHPLHFGIVMIFNLCIGMATPPLGLSLFVMCGISKTTIERITKAILPQIAVAIIVLLLITYIPAIPLALPRLFGLI